MRFRDDYTHGILKQSVFCASGCGPLQNFLVWIIVEAFM